MALVAESWARRPKRDPRHESGRFSGTTWQFQIASRGSVSIMCSLTSQRHSASDHPGLYGVRRFGGGCLHTREASSSAGVAPGRSYDDQRLNSVQRKVSS